MTRTSRLRRLHVVVEPSPGQHEPQERFPRGPSPGTSKNEVPSPNSDQADLDARLAGMAMLLRLALRLMKSHDASPSRRNRGR